MLRIHPTSIALSPRDVEQECERIDAHLDLAKQGLGRLDIDNFLRKLRHAQQSIVRGRSVLLEITPDTVGLVHLCQHRSLFCSAKANHNQTSCENAVNLGDTIPNCPDQQVSPLRYIVTAHSEGSRDRRFNSSQDLVGFETHSSATDLELQPDTTLSFRPKCSQNWNDRNVVRSPFTAPAQSDAPQITAPSLRRGLTEKPPTATHSHNSVTPRRQCTLHVNELVSKPSNDARFRQELSRASNTSQALYDGAEASPTTPETSFMMGKYQEPSSHEGSTALEKITMTSQ